MKSIVTINTKLPTVENSIEYCSGESLQDYDMALFDPELPFKERVHFTGGGSCVSVEGTKSIRAAMHHWARELYDALGAGKTIFVVLNTYKEDLGATGSTSNKNQRTYSTIQFNNYEALPAKIKVRNAKGRQILVKDNAYRGFYDVLKKVALYKVIVDPELGEKVFSTKDGAEVGGVVKIKDLSGHLVLLPHFDLEEYDNKSSNKWSKEAQTISKGIVSQLVAIDKLLKQKDQSTLPPQWLENITMPKNIAMIEASIDAIDKKVKTLDARKTKELKSKSELLQFTHLLYESGKPLEIIIEKSLTLLGYTSENYRSGDLEIDHIVKSPEGLRMIGESEGKDTSAIDISKFRQLESNINEDFERDDVETPAKGIIFGNGYRFSPPSERPEQFTQKCLTNAKRLGTALIRTSDLYAVVMHILDNPEDESFKAACRSAIEKAESQIVQFPK